jgi:hypothetical protein
MSGLRSKTEIVSRHSDVLLGPKPNIGLAVNERTPRLCNDELVPRDDLALAAMHGGCGG